MCYILIRIGNKFEYSIDTDWRLNYMEKKTINRKVKLWELQSHSTDFRGAGIP